MEHGGKMEHRVFWKSLHGVGLFSRPFDFCHRPVQRQFIEIKLAIDHVLGISQKRNFTILIKDFIRVLTSIALTN